MTNPATEVAPWVERMARVGYAAKALLYITVGYLAAQAAVGSGGRVTDTQGALRVVHDASYGRVLLFVVAAGLLGYGLWRGNDREARATRSRAGPRAHSMFPPGSCWSGLPPHMSPATGCTSSTAPGRPRCNGTCISGSFLRMFDGGF